MADARDVVTPAAGGSVIVSLWNYRDWLEYQWVDRPSPYDLRFGSGRNLILAAALNYSPQALLPFVRSLRAVSDCRAALIVDDDPELLGFLGRERVDAIVWPRPSGYEPHVNFARIAGFLHALRRVSFSVDRILWADSRDVIFQSDPFVDVPAAPIVFFAEAAEFTFRHSRMNRRWLFSVCRPIVARALLNKKVLSGGMVLARIDAAIAFCRLKLMLGASLPRWVLSGQGVDQITTNLVAHLEMVDGTFVADSDGMVATLGPNKHYHLNDDGKIVGPIGRPSPVFHQYDRDRTLRAAVYGRYGGTHSVPSLRRSILGRHYYKVRKALHLAWVVRGSRSLDYDKE